MTQRYGREAGVLARPAENPFATRWTRPGQVPPLDADGHPLDVAALLHRLRDLGGSAAVEGPHGSGKTNLLTALAAELDRHGRLFAAVRVRSTRDAVASVSLVWRARPGTIVCIDSWEAMGTALGTIARVIARMNRCGLLVTSHRRTGMPLLWRCETTPHLLSRIVGSLPHDSGRIRPADIREAFTRQRGNVRESLLDLYDLFEGRRDTVAAAAAPR